MSPPIIIKISGGSIYRNVNLLIELGLWARKPGGYCSDSSTGFILPNGVVKSPDAAWVESVRYEALQPKEREGFVPLCPNFMIELRSPTDQLGELQAKMPEYIDNSLELGWLIDPQNQQVEIYRLRKAVEILSRPKVLYGEDVLPEFVLALAWIW